MRTLGSMIAVMIMLLLHLPAWASDPPGLKQGLSSPVPHQGHFLALGLRYGGVRSYDSSRGGWRPLGHGPSPTLRVGQAITNWLDLGLSLGVGFTAGGDTLFLGHLTANAQWYLAERWFVHTGLEWVLQEGPILRMKTLIEAAMATSM